MNRRIMHSRSWMSLVRIAAGTLCALGSGLAQAEGEAAGLGDDTLRCGTAVTGSARMGNGTVAIVGEAVAGRASGVDLVGRFGSIYCLTAGPSIPDCKRTCGDIDGSGGLVDLEDFATFATCYGLSAPEFDCDEAEFACSDLDGNGTINLADFATFANFYGDSSTSSPPSCGG